MRSLYFAIFEMSEETYGSVKELMGQTRSEAEQAALDELATRALTQPKSMTQEDLDRLFEPDGPGKVRSFMQDKLEPVVQGHFKEASDGELAWAVTTVMTSEAFLDACAVAADVFSWKHCPSELLPEGVLLPNGTWVEDALEDDLLVKHLDKTVFVLFEVDF